MELQQPPRDIALGCLSGLTPPHRRMRLAPRSQTSSGATVQESPNALPQSTSQKLHDQRQGAQRQLPQLKKVSAVEKPFDTHIAAGGQEHTTQRPSGSATTAATSERSRANHLPAVATAGGQSTAKAYFTKGILPKGGLALWRTGSEAAGWPKRAEAAVSTSSSAVLPASRVASRIWRP